MTKARPDRRIISHLQVGALKGDKTMSKLATQFDVHPNQIKQWKDQLLDGVTDVFDDKPKASRAPRSTSNRSMRRLAS